MKKIIVVLSVFLLIIGGYTWWSFWEPSEFEEGSIIFELKIPGVIKDFNAIGAKSSPKYKYRIADGVKPSIITMSYCSSSSIRKISAYFENVGLKCENSVDFHGTKCTGIYEGYYMLALLSSEDNCVDVYASFEGEGK
ncbi:hypothetical protein ABT56_10970 [Photobacterium aquae]|uniref:Uncharacterized protein n=1 Tax=Photobacterium aquae TaxID=1195763 RepID=A0A0J1H0Y7_9GAMM|nr:hypothetical protein [Photobacterium aquae]KLV05493.1 hypothetical protein ABT56_10970 [Photobacterium aquae]